MNTDPTLETLIVEAATNFDMPDPENQLLLEFSSTGDPNHGGSRANVATVDNQVYLEGIFLSAKTNTDIRFSTVEDMHRAVRDYQKQFVETGQSLSELRGAAWVPKPTPDPEKAALRVTELTIQPNGDVWGKAVLISPKLRALVLAGWRPVIRVRALGRQSGAVIQRGFKILAFDVAWSSDNKSTLNAFGRAPATSKSKAGTRLNESTAQQQEPAAAAEPATPSKQRLISVELLAEKFEQKKLNENRMREWISSVRNNTDFK
ncbi:hypothetical protein LCM22_13410 [Shewanella chilikensis]|uniref:hypothetical protein n=1 Tax=Shewanella chilikensis TaxID=558541 RepID=UPI001CD65170|nr:hypothetical protein [Shewanella chilikensis]MCA0951153.1 hypothetical protein [Shewanella chilikensis]